MGANGKGKAWRVKVRPVFQPPLPLRWIDDVGRERDLSELSAKSSTGAAYESSVQHILEGSSAELSLHGASLPPEDVERLQGCKQQLVKYCTDQMRFSTTSVEQRPLGDNGLQIDSIVEGALGDVRQRMSVVGCVFIPEQGKQEAEINGKHVLVECTSDSMLLPAKLLQIEAQMELVKQGGSIQLAGKDAVHPTAETTSFAIVYNRQQVNISTDWLQGIAAHCAMKNVLHLLNAGRLLVVYYRPEKSVGSLVDTLLEQKKDIQELEEKQKKDIQELEERQEKQNKQLEEQKKQNKELEERQEKQNKELEEQKKQLKELRELLAKQAGRAAFLFFGVILSALRRPHRMAKEKDSQVPC